jgi:hypothetical protein
MLSLVPGHMDNIGVEIVQFLISIQCTHSSLNVLVCWATDPF